MAAKAAIHASLRRAQHQCEKIRIENAPNNAMHIACSIFISSIALDKISRRRNKPRP
jgi:hypothetical protein